MRTTLLVFATISLVGCETESRPHDPEAEARNAVATIERTFQANLPVSHSNPKVRSTRLMTAVVEGRFEIPMSDFEMFVRESKLLPDELEPTNPLRRREGGPEWFVPKSLEQPRGTEADWMHGDSVASCRLVVGQTAEHTDATVFFEVVYEHKDQTGGMAPAIKADPAWVRDADQPNKSE